MPEEGTADEPLGLDQRSRTIALAGVGVLALLAALGDWAGAFWFPWPLAIGVALVVWFLHRKQQRSSAPRDGAAPPAYDDQLVPDATSDRTADDTAGYATTYDPAYASGTGYPRQRRGAPTTSRGDRATRASAARSCSGSRSR